MKLDELPLEELNYISRFLTEEQDWKALGETCKWCREACLMDTKKRKHQRQFYIGKEFFSFRGWSMRQCEVWDLEVLCSNNQTPPCLRFNDLSIGDFMFSPPGGRWRKFCYFQNTKEVLPMNLLAVTQIEIESEVPTIIRFKSVISTKLGEIYVLDMTDLNDERQQIIRLFHGHLAIDYLPYRSENLFFGCVKRGPNQMSPVAVNMIFQGAILTLLYEQAKHTPSLLCSYVISKNYDWTKMPYPTEYQRFIKTLKGDYKNVTNDELWKWIKNESRWFGIEKLIDSNHL